MTRFREGGDAQRACENGPSGTRKFHEVEDVDELDRPIRKMTVRSLGAWHGIWMPASSAGIRAFVRPRAAEHGHLAQYWSPRQRQLVLGERQRG